MMNLFDLHCDTLYECCETGRPLRDGGFAVSRTAAKQFGHYAQFFALFCGAHAPSDALAKGRHSLLDTPPDERLERMLRTAQREFAANGDWLRFCRSAEDMEEAARQGKAAAFLSIEGAELLPDRPDALAIAYEAGIRLITLTWNYRSRFGCSATVDQDAGLTEAGRALVRGCAQTGIIADVSHLSERGFWDVCEQTDRPFVASHSNARAMCRHPRNLTDAQISEIVRRRGLIGINLYTPFLVRQTQCTLDDVLDHIEHFLGFVGAEHHIALGCDLDGCDELPAEVDGLADLPKLAERMLQKGFKESTVNALFYDNARAFVQKML